MKTIGLLGGMSWESTAVYYQMINQAMMKELGGHHSAKCILYSVNFAEIEQCQREGRWADASVILIEAAVALEKAGVDCLVLCTNTMHKLAEELIDQLTVPFIHIAHATGKEILAQEIKTVGLLATKYTMEQAFYRGEIEKMGLNVIVPESEEREIIHQIIYEELCKGKILSQSREKYNTIIQSLVERGAEGIIMGCTEITLLIKQDDYSIPLFDTTYIHAQEAVSFALGRQLTQIKKVPLVRE